MPMHSGNPKSRAAMGDLALVMAATLLVAWLAVRFELSERLTLWTRPYEHWQLDELALALLALAAGLAWFAYRRWQESRAALMARMQTEARVTQLLEQNRRFARELVMLQEDERRHLARELHDELGQLCNAIKVDAVSIARRGVHEVAAIHATARTMIANSDHIHEILRSLLRRLRPQALDDLGLIAAIQQHLESWEQRHAIACTFVPEGRLDDLGEAVNIALYRALQECLNNVARHATGVHSVTVRLTRSADSANERPRVQLCVEDDGCGVDPTIAHPGLGLAGMRERLSALGGNVLFDSAPGKGARVALAVPVEA